MTGLDRQDGKGMGQEGRDRVGAFFLEFLDPGRDSLWVDKASRGVPVYSPAFYR